MQDLEALIKRLPLTADGVRVIAGDTVYSYQYGRIRARVVLTASNRSTLANCTLNAIPVSSCVATRDEAEKRATRLMKQFKTRDGR